MNNRALWKCLFTCVIALAVAGAYRTPCTATDEIEVATSFYPVYIMALNVTRDVPGARVVNITPAAVGCLHDYSLTAADMKRLAHADIFVTNGAGMESFLDAVAKQFSGLRIVSLSDGIPLIKNSDGTDNSHVWVSITNAMRQVENLGSAMASADPAHSKLYQRNTEEYVARLASLSERMHAQLAPYAGAQIITFHEAFPYFAAEFGLDIAGVIEREPGSAPSAKDLAAIIALVKKTGIRALFAEPQYSARAAETIARQTGAKIYTLDPVVAGPDSRDAYETIMRANLETLLGALKQE